MKTRLLAGAPAATPATSFRLFLQAELARRCAGNPRFSLRAFAARLGVDHSTLSQLLRGRRPATPATIEKLGRRLGLEPEVIERYVAHERLFAVPATAGEEHVTQLARDAAEVLADLRHAAILELTHLADFRPDSRWIARVLDLSPDEVNVALQRLLRLGLLAMAGPSRWVDRSGTATVALEGFGRRVVERLFEQVRALSAAAAAGQDPEPLRHHSSTTLALDPRRLPEALARIEELRRGLTGWLEGQGEPADVYQLEIGFFSLTTLNRRED